MDTPRTCRKSRNSVSKTSSAVTNSSSPGIERNGPRGHVDRHRLEVGVFDQHSFAFAVAHNCQGISRKDGAHLRRVQKSIQNDRCITDAPALSSRY